MVKKQAPAGLKNAETAETLDGFQALGDAIRGHFRTGLGYYKRDFLTRQRELLDVIYRQSWISAKICDAVADDMTRDGVDFSGIDQQQSDVFQRYLSYMQIWDNIADTIRWARLYGGCIAFIYVDGQDVSTPLDPSTIQHGQFKGLMVFDRYRCDPIDTSANTMEPDFYRLENFASKVHSSRILKMVGVKLPYFERIRENWWGGSVISRVFDCVRNRDNALNASGKLINKSYVRTVKINNLRQVLAAGGAAERNLLKMFTMIRDLQDNSGLTILDTEDEFQVDNYTFSGLDNLLSLFDQDVAAAADIPMTRLYGQSPAGFSTGDADLETYYSRIASYQESMLRTPLTNLFAICFASCFGIAPPADFDFVFRNVWRPSEIEDRQQVVNECNTIISACSSGIIGTNTALEALRAVGKKYGLFNAITDQEIAMAAPLESPPDDTAGVAVDPLTGMPDTMSQMATGLGDMGMGGSMDGSMDGSMGGSMGGNSAPAGNF